MPAPCPNGTCRSRIRCSTSSATRRSCGSVASARICQCDLLGQGRAVQPGWQRQGPSRRRHDRRRRARRPAAARWCDRRAHVGQHRCGSRHRRRAARLLVHLRDVRQDEQREGVAAARVRRRGGGVPHRGAARAPRLLLLRRGSLDPRDAGRVPARPVLQPRQPDRARTFDRSGDLGADGRARHALRRRASAPAAPSPASRVR